MSDKARVGGADLPYRPCVGVCLAHPDGRVWVGERAGMPGAWQMPQGGIDKGEDPVEAGLRELEEETGIPRDLVDVEAVTADWVRYDLPDHLIGKALKGRYRGQEQKWLLVRFRGADTDFDIEADHPEFSRWEWVAPDTALERIVGFKRPVYAEVLEEFRAKL